jgi:predicted transposase YdaD
MGKDEKWYNIHHNNQDVAMKYAADLLNQHFFESLGIQSPKVKRALPTGIVRIEMHDLEVDFLCELEDDTLLHLEFQSTYKDNDVDRFMKYDSLIFDKYKKKIRTVVVYGPGIRQAIDEKNYGSILYKVENIYVGKLDGDQALKKLLNKAESKIRLHEKDCAEIVLLPLMKFSVSKSDRVNDAIDIAEFIEDTHMKTKIMSMVLVIANKFLSDKEKQNIMGAMKMTHIFEMIKREGREEGREEGRKEGIKQAAIIFKLVARGYEPSKIAKEVDMPIEEIETIVKDLRGS